MNCSVPTDWTLHATTGLMVEQRDESIWNQPLFGLALMCSVCDCANDSAWAFTEKVPV